MFFSEDLLTKKKGTFGIIWLAATLGPRTKRITRKDLTSIDLSATCDLIAEPPEPMALRLSGCLLVGVARVYNQNYELFYADVNHVHTSLKKALALGLESGGEGRLGAVGIDLPNDGLSRFEQITYTEDDIGLQMGFGTGFTPTDWYNPIAKRKRRPSSKLDSLLSQPGKEDDEEETGSSEEDEETEDGSQLPTARRKKTRLESSPLINPNKNTTIQRTSIYPSDRIDQEQDIPFPQLDQPLDIFELPDPDTSISAPSGRPFDWPDTTTMGPDDPFPMDNDPFFPDQVFSPGGVQNDQRTPIAMLNEGDRSLKSAMKKRKTSDDPDDSVHEVEDELETDLTKKRQKKTRKVTFDRSLELQDDAAASQTYDTLMDNLAREAQMREETKRVALLADEFVVGGGAWVQFFNQDMNVLLMGISKAPRFKWELDVAAHKRGGDMVVTRASPAQLDVEHQAPVYDMAPFDDPFQGDMMQQDDLGVSVTPPDYGDLFNAVQNLPPRQSSVISELEAGRRVSQYSQGPMPWQDSAFKANDRDMIGGPDSSFSTPSLRLSMMTPREIRLRLASKQGSSSMYKSLERARQQARSRSGSILGQIDGEPPRMLIGDNDDDLELPPDDFTFGISESQAEERPLVPEAFQPEKLATLENQCRDFLSYIERVVVQNGTPAVELDDLIQKKEKRVAASAFYNCLTLATKRLLEVDQPTTWGPISIRLSA